MVVLQVASLGHARDVETVNFAVIIRDVWPWTGGNHKMCRECSTCY
jgi:hypothetical protein